MHTHAVRFKVSGSKSSYCHWSSLIKTPLSVTLVTAVISYQHSLYHFSRRNEVSSMLNDGVWSNKLVYFVPYNGYVKGTFCFVWKTYLSGVIGDVNFRFIFLFRNPVNSTSTNSSDLYCLFNVWHFTYPKYAVNIIQKTTTTTTYCLLTWKRLHAETSL